MTLSLRRTARFAGLIGLAALLLTGAARIGVGRFFSSTRGKTMVAEKLGTALGMPVEVSEVDVGDTTSSFRFRVMDPGDPKAEVLNVPSASTDVSAADFVTGRVAPSTLRVKDASLTLRVAPDGQARTPLPALPSGGGVLPAVVVENARLSVQQEGRPEFALGGVNVMLTPSGDRIDVAGTVTDAAWGEWVIKGEFQRAAGTGWVELTCADAPLDPALLEAVPLLARGVFDDVAKLGRAAVTVRVTLGADTGVQPAVEIRPTLALFGAPLGPCFRLTLTSDGYRFEPVQRQEPTPTPPCRERSKRYLPVRQTHPRFTPLPAGRGWGWVLLPARHIPYIRPVRRLRQA